MIEGRPISFNHQNKQPEVMAQVKKELTYLLNRGLARSDVPSTTTMKELGPI